MIELAIFKMAKTRKCKTCGRLFEPKGANDKFCSALCRTAGCFVGGGGDTSKPVSPEQRKLNEKKRAANGGASSPSPEETTKRMRPEKFPRVLQMFELPIEKRYAIASTFTPEEAEYARKLAKRKLQEEMRFDQMCSWDGMEETVGLGSYEGLVGGSIGDSDDGSI